MEMLGIVVLVVGLCVWYGLFALLGDGVESGRKIAQRNLKRLDAASVINHAEQMVSLSARLDDDLVTKSSEAEARLKALMSQQ